ncbi:hypothetical protein D1007_44049 [Hordeum vulgare]|nr:hypothetical protein D1007_44049 [Hordeum vulgare]
MAGGSSSKRPSAQKASSQGAWLGSETSARSTSRRSVTTDCCLRPPKCWCGSVAPRPLPHPPWERSWSSPSISTGASGFGLPANALFVEWLRFFGLQQHHLAPNAILQMSAFVVLCEGFVGIEPLVGLWCSLFFFKRQSIAREKSEVEKLKRPHPMTPCGAALVHHRSKSGFPQMPLQESVKHRHKGFFYVKNVDPAVDALNMPPFDIDPPTRLNWAAKTAKPISEVALICAHLDILEKGGLLGHDLLTTMVVRRILPLQRRPHLVCQMSGRHDPCRLSTKRFTPGAVARRENLISTARMDESGEWTWGMTPFNRSRPPPILYENLQGSLRPPAPDVDVSDALEIEDEGMIASHLDSSAGLENPLELEGTEPSGEYARPSITDWTDDDEIPSFISGVAFEEDSDGGGRGHQPAIDARQASEGWSDRRRRGGREEGQACHSIPTGSEAEDVEEDTAFAAERASWAATDVAQRELEMESKRRWDVVVGKAAMGQSRPSRVEKPV